MSYNPFDKPIHELTPGDLETLVTNEVSEGYWIEFKERFQSNKRIGKSIASFANTYGGWYFIGVEADRVNNVATDICGFRLSEVSDPVSKVRDIIKSHIDPVPVFYLHLVEIGTDRAVLVVHIPDNQETPFITKDGRIYRRVGDSSEPVHENNRFAVDRLVDNGRGIAKRFEEFCVDDRAFSQAEENQAWVNIFISPYPLGSIERMDLLSGDGLEKLIQLSQTPMRIRTIGSEQAGTGHLPFNSGQLAIGSAILRQTEPTRAAFNTLTTQIYFDGRAKFYIPLRLLIDLRRDEFNELESNEVKQVLAELWETDDELSTVLLRFFDIGGLWLAVITLLTYYYECFGEEIRLYDLRVGISLENIWRAVPFVDDDHWANHVRQFGLPVQHNNVVTMPTDIGRGIVLNAEEGFPYWPTICSMIGVGFGLTTELIPKLMEVVADRASRPGAGTELEEYATE